MENSDDWCPSCEESCCDHAIICTTCGTNLQARSSAIESQSSQQGETSTQNGMMQDLQQSNRELASLLTHLRERVSDIRQQVSDIRGQQDVLLQQQEDLQQLAPEAMDPQAAGVRSRPTSKKTLADIPRISIEKSSSVLQNSTLKLNIKDGKVFEAIVGEFGPSAPHHFEKPIVLAEPLTGKGGLQCKANDCIMYMERGDGITFVQKAMMAQQAGAVAVVIGNNTNFSWPYVMKDLKGEAQDMGLNIPVVMISQLDGQDFKENFTKSDKPKINCSLRVEQIIKDCIICVEPLAINQTAVQLPSCGHLFHETCALMWLENHNSCPYCRQELPTDDADYERERVHRQQSAAQIPESDGTSFY
eukprot:CAMPEP_0194252864 /NCGR_PEP_ID=MMETSP0158-20130606/28620_1 /TAXON_ID=33649 /ORGANISM="Thalassionema nitzschioides, Strain L26-B" /LENGTH=359 /DNA_ID=CAMNT_0038990393 /DNA_START=106 /DNA_END=1182 /DNA_ORIENTATION=+